jgi:hypothetical protein
MCDYSLMAVPNRLAQDGEELVTHRFPTGSLGMASPDDVRRATEPRPAERRTLWQRLQEFLDPPPARAVCAVCIPPGARLLIRDIPARQQEQWGVCAQEEAVFTQISATVNYYRDAVRFPSGREVRLQELREGMRICVLDLNCCVESALESLSALG